MGLATPTNQIVGIMNQIIKNGKVLRGWSGVEAQTLSTDIIGSVNLKTGGVLVTAIMRNGSAENAGLVPGDILITIDGMNVNSPNQATETITELILGKGSKNKYFVGLGATGTNCNNRSKTCDTNAKLTTTALNYSSSPKVPTVVKQAKNTHALCVHPVFN